MRRSIDKSLDSGKVYRSIYVYDLLDGKDKISVDWLVRLQRLKGFKDIKLLDGREREYVVNLPVVSPVRLALHKLIKAFYAIPTELLEFLRVALVFNLANCSTVHIYMKAPGAIKAYCVSLGRSTFSYINSAFCPEYDMRCVCSAQEILAESIIYFDPTGAGVHHHHSIELAGDVPVLAKTFSRLILKDLL